MPRKKQRKIHAPLKQDIQIYREMQKNKSPTRSSSPIPSTSSIIQQSPTFNPPPLTTLSEETLSELGLVSVHKKAKEKTKHLDPDIKKPRLDEEINLNFVTPEYLNISEQEFRNILNTPEKIFTLVQDQALGSEEWQLDDDLINMTDEDFEKLIENPDNLEDKLNYNLDENEKEEQQLKETIFAFLLETENELKNISKEDNVMVEQPSTSNINICNEYDSDEDLYEEGLIEKRRQELRNKRTIQTKERELLKRLEEDLEKLKEMQGEKEFPAFLYDQIENEIILKKRKIRNMKRVCKNSSRYRESEKGKETIRRYQHSESGIEARKKYRESEKGKEAQRRYLSSEKGKEARKRYYQSVKEKESIKNYACSEKRKEANRRYDASEKRKEAKKRYDASEKGEETRIRQMEKKRQKRLEEKLRAERDPELKKLLDEKKRIKNEKDKIRREKKKLEKLLLNNN